MESKLQGRDVIILLYIYKVFFLIERKVYICALKNTKMTTFFIFFISFLHFTLSAENTMQELSERISEGVFLCPPACYAYSTSRYNHHLRFDKWCRCPVYTINLPQADREKERSAIGRPPVTESDLKHPRQIFRVSFFLSFFSLKYHSVN